MSIFGIPFFAAGVFVILTLLGVVPMSNANELPALAWPVLVLMAIAFTAVGGVLVFGRSWTIIDRTQGQVMKQWGLLVPLHQRIVPLHGYTAVGLGFVEGDSDTADRFPIVLKALTGADLPLCNFTVFAQARECAKAVAEHLHLELEDASTDHPVRLHASQIDVPLQQRMRNDVALGDVIRPPGARSQVTREVDGVTIVIPSRPIHAVLLAAGLIPIAIALVLGPPLATFFRRSKTPDPIAWTAIGLLTLFFVIFPTVTIVNAFVRSRRGATIIAVSKQRLHIQERGAWATRTIASFDAADILDVDYSSQASTIASAQRAAEQQVVRSYPSEASTVSPRVERMVAALTRFAKGKGIIVKTRTGLTTFGRGLDDAEIHYLHSVVRRALIGGPKTRL